MSHAQLLTHTLNASPDPNVDSIVPTITTNIIEVLQTRQRDWEFSILCQLHKLQRPAFQQVLNALQRLQRRK